MSAPGPFVYRVGGIGTSRIVEALSLAEAIQKWRDAVHQGEIPGSLGVEPERAERIHDYPVLR